MDKGRCYLKLMYFRKTATALVEEGHALGFDEIVLQNVDCRNQTALALGEKNPEGKLLVKEDDCTLTISGAKFRYTMSKLTGMWQSMVWQGRKLLDRPMELNIWRAPTDNDMYIKLEWKRAHYDRPVIRAYETTYEKAGSNVQIHSTLSLSAETVQRMMDVAVTWTVNAAGEIETSISVLRNP